MMSFTQNWYPCCHSAKSMPPDAPDEIFSMWSSHLNALLTTVKELIVDKELPCSLESILQASHSKYSRSWLALAIKSLGGSLTKSVLFSQTGSSFPTSQAKGFPHTIYLRPFKRKSQKLEWSAFRHALYH